MSPEVAGDWRGKRGDAEPLPACPPGRPLAPCLLTAVLEGPLLAAALPGAGWVGTSVCPCVHVQGCLQEAQSHRVWRRCLLGADRTPKPQGRDAGCNIEVFSQLATKATCNRQSLDRNSSVELRINCIITLLTLLFLFFFSHFLVSFTLGLLDSSALKTRGP